MKPATATIIDVCNDTELFASWFRDATTWRAWFAFLRTLFGLMLSPDELETFRQCTGRAEPPSGGAREAWLIVGRRGGKSLILAIIAVFLAIFVDWSPYLTPGERGTIMVIAADRRQARTIFRYVNALLRIPLIGSLIARETADAIDLNNGITIEILTASFRTVRGYSLVAALCDEVAFWRSDETGANPDKEIIAAIRPAMATIPGAMLLCASSPYARRGVLWEAFRRHFGKSGPVLVWKADTRTMNPTVPQSIIDEAIEADPSSAAAEYGADFRSDVESFVSREVVDAAVIAERHELPPIIGLHSYVAFTDPSGGSADSMTLAVAHRENNKGVLDLVRERRPPFSPEDVVEEFAAILNNYRISSVRGDRYAGEWPRERFRAHGIEYELSDRPKSDLYRDFLPAINSGCVELLDVPRLTAQLVGLERRTVRGGRDSIDHSPGAHDDVANAAVGALVGAIGTQGARISFGSISLNSRDRQQRFYGGHAA